jgi:hypothetical protein
MRFPPQIRRLMWTFPILPMGIGVVGPAVGAGAGLVCWAQRACSSRLNRKGAATLAAADFFRKFLRLALCGIGIRQSM